MPKWWATSCTTVMCTSSTTSSSVRHIRRVGPLRVARVLRMSLRDRLEATVVAVKVPVRVVVGEKDTLSEGGWQSSLGRPVGAPVVMDGLPHSSPHFAPEGFARLVTEWNAELRAAAEAAS